MAETDLDFETLVEDFEFFDAWEDRYRYLIDLGRQLPPMDEADKTEANRVRGCISKVWVVPANQDGRLVFTADSDSHIVRGLVALARVLFHGKTKAEVQAVDLDQVFSRLGFDAHLSVNRRNGFQSLVRTLKAFAETL